jgi:hypothetical protein
MNGNTGAEVFLQEAAFHGASVESAKRLCTCLGGETWIFTSRACLSVLDGFGQHHDYFA